ncbi:Apoptosis-inducing factor 2, partial [Larimichthys crocea]
HLKAARELSCDWCRAGVVSEVRDVIRKQAAVSARQHAHLSTCSSVRLCDVIQSVSVLAAMGAQSSSVEGAHVVVVGGGFGGVAAAQQLKSLRLDFTLIDMRDAFHHNVAALRASVQTGFAQRTFIPYTETFGGHFVQGRVKRVDTDRQVVVLEGGRPIRKHTAAFAAI